VTTDWAIDEWRFLLDVLQILAIVALWTYTVVTRRSQANTKILEDHDGRLDDIEKDLVQIRQRLDDAPSHDDLQRIHDRVSDVKNGVADLQAGVSGLTASVEAITRNLTLLNSNLVRDKQ
jgi:type VI protein secretion system component VasK